MKVIDAIFENGTFRPLGKIVFPEHQKIKLFIEEDEISTKLIAFIAEKSESFDFLKKPEEDIYTLKDGEPV